MALAGERAVDRGGVVSGRGRGRRTAPGPDRGALRVVGGSVGGRRLDAPGGTATRPTSERVRQATFNALESLDAVDGARGIDAFAGSGALGIEALSRGAAHVTFAETDAAARAVVSANVAAVGLTDRARVLAGDGIDTIARHGPWDLVLLDPPYTFDRWPDALAAVQVGLASGGIVVVESDREVALPAGLHPLRVKAYGGTVVLFASPVGAPS